MSDVDERYKERGMESSKAYTTDTKVKLRRAVDGKWVCDTESFAFGTIIEDGSTPAAAVAAVIQAMCEAYNRLWAEADLYQAIGSKHMQCDDE